MGPECGIEFAWEDRLGMELACDDKLGIEFTCEDMHGTVLADCVIGILGIDMDCICSLGSELREEPLTFMTELRFPLI